MLSICSSSSLALIIDSERKFLDTARGVVNCERDLLYSTGPRGMDFPGGFNK